MTAIESFFVLPDDWLFALSKQYDWNTSASLVEFVLKSRAEGPIAPAHHEMFQAFEWTRFDEVKVIVLGQDPYPTLGHAHGLAFSVQPGVLVPASLRNIFKELEHDLGIPRAAHGYLRSWAKQGVLLLNTVLTVQVGQAGSHRKRGWELFTDAVIVSLSERPKPSVFWLWGKDAQAKRSMISNHHVVLESPHPSPLSARRGFFGSKPFSKTNELLRKWGQQTIVWSLPDMDIRTSGDHEITGCS